MRQLIVKMQGGKICTTKRDKAVADPQRYVFDEEGCFNKGKKIGVYIGVKIGENEEKKKNLNKDLELVDRLNGVELRPYTRKYNIRGYARMAPAEIRDAVKNAIQNELNALRPRRRR